MNIDIDYVKAQLQRRRSEKQLAKIARLTGLHPRSLYYIVDGGRDGRVSTLQKLQSFLKATENLRIIQEEKEP